jgi:hypothetical protein
MGERIEFPKVARTVLDENEKHMLGILPLNPVEGCVPIGVSDDDDWVPDDDDAPDAPPGDVNERHTRGDLQPDPARGARALNAAAKAAEPPTAAEPLRGLEQLAAVAIIGRSNVLELATRPVVYLWRDIAIAGIIVVIAGGPGSGKTTLLFLILVARLNLDAPVNVLGREVSPAPPGRFVVLIEAEHGAASAARKLSRSCRLLGVDDMCLDRVILVARKSVRIGSVEWGQVGRMVAAGLVSDIAIDTLARVAPADANSESEQVNIFDQIAQTIDLAPEHAKPVAWVVAHTRKSESLDLSDVSGSVQRTGQADTVLLVQAERRDGKVVSSKVTFPKLREEPDEYPGPTEYSITGNTLNGMDAPPAVDDRPLETRILERLQLGPQLKTKLREMLGRSAADMEPAISNLFQSRAIRTTEVTVRGKLLKAFELVPAAHSGSGNES